MSGFLEVDDEAFGVEAEEEPDLALERQLEDGTMKTTQACFEDWLWQVWSREKPQICAPSKIGLMDLHPTSREKA
jgi:hypothetical protein